METAPPGTRSHSSHSVRWIRLVRLFHSRLAYAFDAACAVAQERSTTSTSSPHTTRRPRTGRTANRTRTNGTDPEVGPVVRRGHFRRWRPHDLTPRCTRSDRRQHERNTLSYVAFSHCRRLFAGGERYDRFGAGSGFHRPD